MRAILDATQVMSLRRADQAGSAVGNWVAGFNWLQLL